MKAHFQQGGHALPAGAAGRAPPPPGSPEGQQPHKQRRGCHPHPQVSNINIMPALYQPPLLYLVLLLQPRCRQALLQGQLALQRCGRPGRRWAFAGMGWWWASHPIAPGRLGPHMVLQSILLHPPAPQCARRPAGSGITWQGRTTCPLNMHRTAATPRTQLACMVARASSTDLQEEASCSAAARCQSSRPAQHGEQRVAQLLG